ncbi:hypothetical protein RFI_01241 [Reticulomyxa filosa]|uniref:Uncharacterized protein n=1 Tax=Reticulomyxa filosa TaxID=46433 RepID=X6PCM0_RETFI|nr:hypothetical protein RFI_01241 [Reticulomyxa filosa]|eukprot:ETO35819.1 hypothetical protein RFI_01241 [Reticulomyxa filosa]
MGNLFDSEVTENMWQQQLIERQLEIEHLEVEGKRVATTDRSVHKLVLLGTKRSKKSAVFNLLGGRQYSDLDKQRARPLIHAFIIEQMQDIIDAAEGLNYTFDESVWPLIDEIFALPQKSELTTETAKIIKTLWSNETIKKAFREYIDLGNSDNCVHFFNSIDKIAEQNYLPSDQDLQLSNMQSSYLFLSVYNTNDNNNDNNTTSLHGVIFVVDLACFDQTSRYNTIHPMTETINLWDETVNDHNFSGSRVCFILLFYNFDLFCKKISKASINIYFSDYQGPDHSLEESICFIRTSFLSRVQDRQRQIYTVSYFVSFCLLVKTVIFVHDLFQIKQAKQQAEKYHLTKINTITWQFLYFPTCFFWKLLLDIFKYISIHIVFLIQRTMIIENCVSYIA